MIVVVQCLSRVGMIHAQHVYSPLDNLFDQGDTILVEVITDVFAYLRKFIQK